MLTAFLALTLAVPGASAAPAAAIVAPVTDSEADPTVSRIFGEVIARGGQVTPLYRSLARAPHILDGWKQFSWTLRDDSTAPRAIRELMILRILQLGSARQEFAVHERLGLKAGLSDAQIAALPGWSGSTAFSPAERAALAVAEQIFSGPASGENMAALKRFFSDREMVELTMTASFYVTVLRFTQSMGL